MLPHRTWIQPFQAGVHKMSCQRSGWDSVIGGPIPSGPNIEERRLMPTGRQNLRKLPFGYSSGFRSGLLVAFSRNSRRVSHLGQRQDLINGEVVNRRHG